MENMQLVDGRPNRMEILRASVRVALLLIFFTATITIASSTILRSVPPSAAAVSQSLSSMAELHRFSVAPMMKITDRHQRYLQRLLSKHTVLYTEMISANAIVHNPEPARFLQANFRHEEPLVLQLGGADVEAMRKATRIAKDFGYTEININSGCPSSSVADAGAFGAALMRKPLLVAELASVVQSETGMPATVKCRIGVDDQDSYENLHNFVSTVSTQGGVRHFIVHARKAILGLKLTPAQNRSVPPLKYEYVYRLVKDFPHLIFSINGGIKTLDEAEAHIRDHGVHGVMVGRAVSSNPFGWNTVDSRLYGTTDPGLSRREVLERYAEYARMEEEAVGPRCRQAVVAPIRDLFNGEHNGKHFRNHLHTKTADRSEPLNKVILEAMRSLLSESLDATEKAVIQRCEENECTTQECSAAIFQ